MRKIPGGLAKLAVIALAIMLAGGGTAAAAKLITGKQIKNGTIGNADIKKGALAADRLSAAARSALKGDRGPAGPGGPGGAAGAAGQSGAQGPQGARGPSDVFVHRRATHTIVDANTRTIATQNLPPGIYSVQVKFAADPTNSAQADCRLRNGVANDVDTTAVDLVAGNATQVVLAGTITVAQGAGGLDDDARILCFGEGALGNTTATNTAIVATQVTNVTATSQ